MAHEYTPIFYYNFTDSFDINSFEYKIAHDGNVTRNNTGLTINTEKYITHVDPGITGLLDHIKWLVFTRKSYQVYEGEFIYEACMSAQQLISPNIIPDIYRNRIRNLHEDYRLCSSGIVVYDEDSMITTKILFTNDWIYGYYERRPGYKSGWLTNNPTFQFCCFGDYASFAAIIPLCKRGSFAPVCHEKILDDFVRVGIGIDSQKGTIKFYVNRIELYCIPKIGYRLSDTYQVSEYGGTPYLISSGSMKFGFGHFSYLDHNIPNNYSRQYVIETLDSNGFPVHRLASGLAQLLPTDKYREPYPDFTGEHTSIDPNISFAYSGTDSNFFNFGQGMITRIKYIAGYVINNRIKMHKMIHNSNDESEWNVKNKVSNCSGDDSSEKNFTARMLGCFHENGICGPIPEIYRIKNPEILKYTSQNNDSMRMLLYVDVSSQSNSFDDSRSSYSFGDLYKQSRKRQYIMKGESKPEENQSKNNIEQIIFLSNDMALNV